MFNAASDFESAWRSPRLRLLVNGALLTGASDVTVKSTGCYGADSFAAIAAIGADAWAGAEFWASETSIAVDIGLNINGEMDCTSLLQGLVDVIVLDPISNVVRISGRDYTAGLIEARTDETFANHTASEVACIIATRHDLVPCVVPTTTFIGRYYESQRQSFTLDRFSRATTEWDLITYLARQEGYDVFVEGRNFCFQPAMPAGTVDIMIRPTDVTDMKLLRSLPLARAIEVTVSSWNSSQRQTFTETISSTLMQDSATVGQSSTEPPLKYALIRPNLTPDMATKLAVQQITEMTRHERTVEFSMPGELAMTPRSVVFLEGTGTDFDQTYFVSEIRRNYRPKTGFTQRVRMQSSSPRLTQMTGANLTAGTAT